MAATNAPSVDLGRVGVWHFAFAFSDAAASLEAAAEIDELGYGTIMYPEALGLKDCFALGAQLLSATKRAVVAPGIANIWARDAITMMNGARTLCEANPGRFLLGIGVGHAERVSLLGMDYRKPLSLMNAYLDRMEEATYAGGDVEVPLMLAALRPKMLELSAKRTLGAHPYFVPVQHATRAREIVGPDRLVVTELALVLEEDPAAARAAAREYATSYLALENYRANLRTLGYTDDDFADGGSDRLIDEVIAWGSLDAVRDRVKEHLDAGADHVCIQPIVSGDPGFPLRELRELAPALLDL